MFGLLIDPANRVVTEVVEAQPIETLIGCANPLQIVLENGKLLHTNPAPSNHYFFVSGAPKPTAGLAFCEDITASVDFGIVISPGIFIGERHVRDLQ